MEYDFEKVKDFIEKFYGMKLYDYQLQILKALLEGKYICLGRLNGRTIVHNGMKEYEKQLNI